MSRTLYRHVCNAACSLAAVTITAEDAAGNDHRSDLFYLAMAAGFCGRMALGGIEGPLEDMTEILRIAQQSIKERQQRKLGQRDGRFSVDS